MWQCDEIVQLEVEDLKTLKYNNITQKEEKNKIILIVLSSTSIHHHI